jgi:hypothetical protein
LTVADGTAATPAVGTVALIGEAESGLPFSEEKGLSAVTYGPGEVEAIKEKYTSGPLVDAARLALAASADPQIQGGAQELLLLKTNASEAASLEISVGTLTAKKPGEAGNQISYKCTASGSTRTLTLQSKDTQEVETIGGTAAMTLQCTDATASAAKVSIGATYLTTTITGGTTAQNLNVKLSDFASIEKLCEYISTFGGYTATPASAVQKVKPVSRLDRVTDLDIKTSGTVYQDAAETRDFFAKSSMVSFEPSTYVGLPAASGQAALSGGAKGGTSPAAILDCFDALLKRRVNFIVPLFSRDAADDIADGLTDSDSTYTIDAVHAAAKSHVAEASTVKGRKERQAWVGYKGSWDDTMEKSAALNSARVSMCFQDVLAQAADGTVQTMQPHMLAVISAGMHAAAPIGLSTTFKAPNILGFEHDEFHPEVHAEKGIMSNLTFVESAPQGGFRFVLDNSTYASDTNAWIYNRPAVVFAGDFAAFAIRLSTEQYVGRRNSDVSVETIKNLLTTVFDNLRSLGVIVGDAKTGGRGFKDLVITIEGSIVRVGVTLSLVENLEFILSDIKVQRAG